MEGRWLHRARLHIPEHGKERKVGWLELFYDLIYVATIIQLGDALSHGISDGHGVIACVGFAGLFVPLWFSWTAFTFYSNRFIIDDSLHRGIVFAQMFCIAGLAVMVGRVFEGDVLVFGICYALVRYAMALLYWRAYRHVEEARGMTGHYLAGTLVGATIWLVGAFVPAPWTFLIWIVAQLVDFGISLAPRARALESRFPPDVLHASERYGLLTIIVLGESFVKVLSSVAEKVAEAGELKLELAVISPIALLVTFSLWWIYFDDVAGSRIKRKASAPFIWVFAHLPMTIGITAVGVAVKKVATVSDPLAPLYPEYRWLFCGALALALLSVGVVDSVTERRQAELSDEKRVKIRLGSAALVLLLAPVGGTMPAVAFAAMIAAICLAQVFLDLSFSPMFADADEAEEEDHAMWARTGPVPVEKSTKRRLEVSDAVRKGAPTELRRDLYFHLMQASWTQLFAWVVGLYLLINVVFASLFMLDPASVGGMNPESFLEAFSFSVQTVSTIGYGTLHPTTPYSHSLVAVEVLIGLLGIALVTGLVFAKAARPTSSVLFCHFPVIQQRHGKQTLLFRAGNARGNDIVDASIKVSILKEEVTPEGHNMRRMYDLKLVRDNQPLFSLSWTVMHVIDEESPLHGLTAENCEEFFVALVVMMTGHDGTYAQTVHARKIYESEDLRFNHRLVDVISTLGDGRMLVDYTKFHLTSPEEGEPT